MLNENRYNSVKAIFQEKGVSLSENDVQLYADVFEIIAQLTNGKLTDREIMDAYDFLSDLILNNRPGTFEHVKKEDRIRVQVKWMEKIPYIRGKLTEEEKTVFAFCIYLGECIRVYDEERNAECNGVVLFKSVENIINEYEYTKKTYPSLFSFTIADNSANERRDDFGYVPQNPIWASSVGESYAYLNKLGSSQGQVTYQRIGSSSDDEGNIIDVYEITVSKKFFIFKKEKKYKIYINPYAPATSKLAPTSFCFRYK